MSHEIVTTYTCDRCGVSAVGRGPEAVEITSNRSQWRGPFRPERWTEVAFPYRSSPARHFDLCSTCAVAVEAAIAMVDPEADR